MKLSFKKLIVEKRFNDSFKDWKSNNEIEFPRKGFVDIYAPNGVGKSSLAKAIKKEITSNCEFEYEIDGVSYSENSDNNPILVIDDFFCRNIAPRDKESLSDYMLGSKIKEELELDSKLKDEIIKVGEKLNTYLKNEYGISKKDSNISKKITSGVVKDYIKDLSSSKTKGKNYKAEEILNLIGEIKLEDLPIEDANKFNYFKNNIEDTESAINAVINFNIDDFSKINGVKRLDYTIDAVKILERHKELKRCIFDDSHELPRNLKETLEENKNTILNGLTPKQKSIVDKILNVDEEIFYIKNTFINAFETGNSDYIVELKEEIMLNLKILENEIYKKIKNEIESSKIVDLYRDLKKLKEEKVELTEEDEILLRAIIKSCINKDVTFERDENKNIIFKINNENVIGKTRQELPLSTGEQNFISLYFELLAAKNSNKDIVIIDDPISSFDSIYKNKIVYAIVKILKEKNTIVLTHNINTIKLMHHQYEGCFNMYLLKNDETNNNGFLRVKNNDLNLVLEIKNVIKLFKDDNFISSIKNKNLFLVAVIPFLRSYANILPIDSKHYKELCKLMHGYVDEVVNLNDEYSEIFGKNIIPDGFNISTSYIISLEISGEIVDSESYPLLNDALYNIANYLQLRLLVENTLYNIDKRKINIEDNVKLSQIITKYLDSDSKLKTELMSKKTLLNEFNHFEYDMCLFLPFLDISAENLLKEKKRIKEICDFIKTQNSDCT